MAVSLGCFAILISGIIGNLYVFMASLFFAGFGLNGFEALSLSYISEISGKFNLFINLYYKDCYF